MSVARTAFAFVLLAGLGSAAALSQSPPAPQSPPVPQAGPMRVTTDTLEYCDDLAGRVAAERQHHPEPQPEAEVLAQEGQHMCDTGLIRGGLVRLRRALLLLRAEK